MKADNVKIPGMPPSAGSTTPTKEKTVAGDPASASNPAVDEKDSSALPALPLTLEGASVLHHMYRIDWARWNRCAAEERASVAGQSAEALAALECTGRTALYSILGHKADLLILHFRDSLDELNDAQLALDRLPLREFLEPSGSYVSVVELGLYESTVKLYRSFAERKVAPHSPEWNAEIEEMLKRQQQAMRPRLFPAIPEARYLCFYPMERRRGESKNWYTLPILDRQRQMEEHGAVGRRYAGRVQQIISGSIGYDDWEWGVDLFAADPVAFKKLIYEMRFDEVSAVYSDFGTFYLGVRTPANDLPQLLTR